MFPSGERYSRSPLCRFLEVVMKLPALTAALLLIAACSSPRPAPARKDAVLTGDTTARAASEATRDAEKSGDTGVIVTSSEAAEPPADGPATQPSAPTVLEIALVNGATMIDGAAVADVTSAVKLAVDAGDVVVRIVADAQTPYARVVEVMDAVRAAGVDDIVLGAPPAPPAPADPSSAPAEATAPR